VDRHKLTPNPGIPKLEEDLSAIEPEKQDRNASDKLSMIKWHIERYDRLRTSATSRAAVVLSAAALLSAGNAVFLAQILGTSVPWLRSWRLLILSLLALVSAILVILALLRAANVLLTARGSREVFAGAGDAPLSPIFNGSDTVSRFTQFDDFQSVLLGQSDAESVEAAAVELWICINQHRGRYTQLRRAVNVLRYAGIAFLAALISAVALNIAYSF
jgi:hypothetical protein